MNPTAIKVIKWIIFIPVVYFTIGLFKFGALMVQFWIKKQVHEASGWSYFVAETTFGWFWIPYMLLYLLINAEVNGLCTKPKIGAAMILPILVLNSIHFYFISGAEIYTSWVLADLTAYATLGYILYERE
jgi:hypothetical protein